ncbi:MAG: ABC transporter permease, partial [Nocardioidaceae bacterium]
MITWVGFAASLTLVAVAVAASMVLSLRLECSIVTASIRMSVQLALVGGVLSLVIDPQRSIWWSWLWVAAMVGYASDVAARRAPQVPNLRWLALGAFGAAAVISMAVLFGLRVFPVDGRTVVPLAG